MRNALFLTIAANRAVRLGAKYVYIGVSQEDYGGYPDCRGPFISRIEDAINLALEDVAEVHIFAPLLYKTKKETVELAASLPGCLEMMAYTHTCYNGDYPPCGHCHACLLRDKGFTEAGIEDPLITRFHRENGRVREQSG
jgi:7-cyano-7-deazaguanine synthase